MKTTWILGAGASISHTNGGFPSIDGFFAKAKEFGITTQGRRRVRPEFLALADYVRTRFGKSILRKSDFINIETLLTLLDIDFRSSGEVEDLQKYDQTLRIILGLFDTLHGKLDRSHGEYRTFVQKLEPTDTIITFNWDTLLDDFFGRRDTVENFGKNEYDPPDNQYTNYIEHLSSYSDFTYQGFVPAPYTENTQHKGLYLKLHGSIDWAYCTSVNCRFRNKVLHLIEFQKQHNCNACHSKLRRLIVPPLLEKHYGELPKIQELWTSAEKEIEHSRKIVVWGYSLPPTDFHANRLLRSALPLDSLTIINPSLVSGRSTKHWNRSFLKNILDPIGHKARDVEFYEYFSDFCQERPISSKHGLKAPYSTKR